MVRLNHRCVLSLVLAALCPALCPAAHLARRAAGRDIDPGGR